MRNGSRKFLGKIGLGVVRLWCRVVMRATPTHPASHPFWSSHVITDTYILDSEIEYRDATCGLHIPNDFVSYKNSVEMETYAVLHVL